MTYIFDLDGTLSDSRHRDEYAQRGEWDTFHGLAYLDKPRKDVEALYRILSVKESVIILTGRTEKYREATRIWLNRFNFMYYELIMRPNGNYMKSPDWKLGVLSSIKSTTMVFDDRKDIVMKLLENNIPAIQVAEYGD